MLKRSTATDVEETNDEGDTAAASVKDEEREQPVQVGQPEAIPKHMVSIPERFFTLQYAEF